MRMDPFSPREGKELAWKGVNMTLTSKEGEKHLLTNIYGDVPKKNVTAIMGPSGAGKTSLLNILAGRASSHGNLTIESDVRLDGKTIDPTNPNNRKLVAFVAQDDSLPASTTPREAIKFSAKLRLPNTTTDDEIDNITERMLKELGLESCSDTFVGGPLLKGLSGGERKRTSVGVELVVKPDIVFLDEPTSGLDSFSAVQLVNLLHKVSNAGASVLMTIHQPSSEVFASLDYLLLLNKGRVMYNGRVEGVPASFGELGYPCPPNYNPSDHMMLVAQTVEETKLEADGFFPADTRDLPPVEKIGKSDATVDNTERVSKTTELKLLFEREMLNLKRDTVPLYIRFGITIFLNILYGLIFQGIGSKSTADSIAINSRFGALIMSILSVMFGTAQPALIALPSERPVFLREYYTNHYSVYTYFVSRFAVEAAITFAQVMVQAVLTYFLMELTMKFYTLVLILYAIAMASTAVAILMGAFVEDVAVAQELMPLLFVPQMLFAGFFIATDLLPDYIRWAQYLCSLTYAIRLALVYEFDDCSDDGPDGIENCENLLDYTKAKELDIYVYWAILIALFAVFRVLAMFSLAKNASKFY
uniref:ABC transporter domain-containing protein n=1 Tax=Leptocylindrus danicus TaxID=163516 RepID=A0A7S2LEQ2_9STRA